MRGFTLTKGELICLMRFLQAPLCNDLESGPPSPELEEDWYCWVRGERGKVARDVGR